MRAFLLLVLIALSTQSVFAAQSSSAQDAAFAIVPRPADIQAARGVFKLHAQTSLEWTAIDESIDGQTDLNFRDQALLLSEELHFTTGMQLPVAKSARADDAVPEGAIRLTWDAKMPRTCTLPNSPAQAYRIEVAPTHIELRSGTRAGMACAIASLLQLVQESEGKQFHVPGVSLKDAPAHEYRSIMIDVARTPHSIATLQDVIRLAHLYKLRFLHLHLTDDQLFTFPFAPVVDNLQNNQYFTESELIDLQAYAELRGITIIPEIDLPGHSRRLLQSGYLSGAEGHRDVASEQHFPAMAVLLEEVMRVFSASPYLHIGGDESGAGDQLVPFLGRVQELVRANDKHLIVWEGFHGAPLDVLPAKGPDRVLVAAWESSYNAPWDLLEAGYELINASWRPLYVVGGHSVIHPGTSSGRKWPHAEIAAWDVDLFTHWEPGRPVFEDRGPKDNNRDDQQWRASWIDRQDQLLGAQICVWEQRETSVVEDLRFRLPALADRTWSSRLPSPKETLQRIDQADAKVYCIVKPVGVRQPRPNSPTGDVYYPNAEGATPLELYNRSRIPGTVVSASRDSGGSLGWWEWKFPEAGTEQALDAPIPNGSWAIRASLRGTNGQLLPGISWIRTSAWPDRVRVEEREFGVRGLKQFPSEKDWQAKPIVESYRMPTLRGALRQTRARCQDQFATLQAPASGKFQIGLKTQSGHARIWIDLNRDGQFDSKELLIARTENDELYKFADVEFEAGALYPLRVQHLTALPRPVVVVAIQGPDMDKRQDVSFYLLPLDAAQSPTSTKD